MTIIEKTILNNQLIMMKVLNELLFAHGVTAHRTGVNLHEQLRNHWAATEEVLKDTDTEPNHGYVYAGFVYDLTSDIDGKLTLTPAPGQHPAAGKMKHRQAALEQYKQDHNIK